MQIPGRNFLWALPERSEFIILDSHTCTGLGTLCKPKMLKFEAFHEEIIRQIQRGELEDVEHLSELRVEASALLRRLQHLSMGFRSTCRTVRALQRVLLELEASIAYHTVYKLSISTDHNIAAPSEVSHIGCYVHNIQDAEICQRMKIPHWFIRPYERVLQCHIQSIAAMHHSSHVGLSDEAISGALPIFIGPASDPTKYTSIRRFGLNCIRFPDPFHSVCLPEPIISSPGPARSDIGNHRALTHSQRMKKIAFGNQRRK